jgi:hypothetical protein
MFLIGFFAGSASMAVWVMMLARRYGWPQER